MSRVVSYFLIIIIAAAVNYYYRKLQMGSIARYHSLMVSQFADLAFSYAHHCAYYYDCVPCSLLIRIADPL